MWQNPMQIMPQVLPKAPKRSVGASMDPISTHGGVGRLGWTVLGDQGKSDSFKIVQRQALVAQPGVLMWMFHVAPGVYT